MSQFKQWIFILASLGFMASFIISGIGLGYELIAGVELWWALPLGWFGVALWVVHMYMLPQVKKHLKRERDGREET